MSQQEVLAWHHLPNIRKNISYYTESRPYVTTQLYNTLYNTPKDNFLRIFKNIDSIVCEGPFTFLTPPCDSFIFKITILKTWECGINK